MCSWGWELECSQIPAWVGVGWCWPGSREGTRDSPCGHCGHWQLGRAGEHPGEAQGPVGGWQCSLPWAQPWAHPRGWGVSAAHHKPLLATPRCSCLLRAGKHDNLMEEGLGAPAAPAGMGLGWVSLPPPSLPSSFPTDFCFSVDFYLEAAVCFGQCVLTPSWQRILRVMDDTRDCLSLHLGCVSVDRAEAAPSAAAGVKRPLQS